LDLHKDDLGEVPLQENGDAIASNSSNTRSYEVKESHRFGAILRSLTYHLIIQEEGPAHGTSTKSFFGRMEWQ
jgi:hypothetical protein